jgi:hypothetical protein
MLDQHERCHGFEHGDLNFLTFAGSVAVKQRHRRGIERGEAGDLVRHDGAHVVGFAGQQFLNRGQPALGLDRVVVGGQIVVGSAPTVSVAVGVDDLRVDRSDLVVAEAQPRNRLWRASNE